MAYLVPIFFLVFLNIFVNFGFSAGWDVEQVSPTTQVGLVLGSGGKIDVYLQEAKPVWFVAGVLTCDFSYIKWLDCSSQATCKFGNNLKVMYTAVLVAKGIARPFRSGYLFWVVSDDNNFDSGRLRFYRVGACFCPVKQLKPGRFYYVDVFAKSTARFYFYGCSGPGGFKNEIYFSVEESSYYHQGAIEPLIRFVGDHVPRGRDYPTWGDYYTIAGYLYRDTSGPRETWQMKSTELNPCPKDYLYDWTTWYGKQHPAYQDLYYCMGLPLTRILEIYTPENSPKCGYWTVTLFNNTDSGRHNVRLFVLVSSYSK